MSFPFITLLFCRSILQTCLPLSNYNYKYEAVMEQKGETNHSVQNSWELRFLICFGVLYEFKKKKKGPETFFLLTKLAVSLLSLLFLYPLH